jgi:hypothetical protein
MPLTIIFIVVRILIDGDRHGERRGSSVTRQSGQCYKYISRVMNEIYD